MKTPGRHTTDPKFDDAVRAVADGMPVAWRELEDAREDSERVKSLRLIDDIAAVFRNDTNAQTAHRGPVMFHWGGLEVESVLGEGSYGEVYRAFDPWLGRAVALKLFRASATPGAGLDEARRLARLRHRNVLSVYGCGVHDGRAGLWSELIEGRTLSAIAAADGMFSAEETLRVGHDLANALGVVHAAGIVHGDVKAENVMREVGGRIVLMDFGAGGEARLLAGRRLISGTPRYLPPEVLDGAPLGTSSDIYALGVLLFLLLGGRYPYQAIDAAALREEQRNGNRPPLHSLRPDVETSLCTLIEGCMASEPSQRPASAHALSAKFAELLRERAPKTSSRVALVALAVAAAALLAIAAFALWPLLSPPAWETTVQFLRVEALGNVDIAANSTLHVGDRLRLSVRSSRDVYVYVLNEDDAGNATLLFPDAGEPHTPVHANTALTLPGGERKTLAWEVTADSPREEFVVIAATEPQTNLESVLSTWKRAESGDADVRAVGSVVDVPLPVLHGEHLREILAAIRLDPEHVRVWQYAFAHDL